MAKSTTVDPLNPHHILPVSRNGLDENNIVSLPMSFHQGWHALFGNLTVPEVHEFIDILNTRGSTWGHKMIGELRSQVLAGNACPRSPTGSGRPVFPEFWTKAWRKIFGDLTVTEAHAFVDNVMRPGTWTWEMIRKTRKRAQRKVMRLTG